MRRPLRNTLTSTGLGDLLPLRYLVKSFEDVLVGVETRDDADGPKDHVVDAARQGLRAADTGVEGLGVVDPIEQKRVEDHVALIPKDGLHRVRVVLLKPFGEKRHLVLNEASFDVPAGKTTVIAGGSGQGKSVTLKLILGLLKPDAGQVLVFGKNVAALGVHALRELRMQFGVLFQGSALFDSLTVFENVALPLRERTPLWRPP